MEGGDKAKQIKIERYNKLQYKKRFGISYSNVTRKDLDFPDFRKKKIESNSRLNSILNIDSPFHRKPINPNLLNDLEQKEIDKIYGTNGKEYDDILPIHNFDRVTKCSVLKYGIKNSTEEIEYSYCKTCDYNLLKPICIFCINQCHKGHSIKYIFNKGRIKCNCGEKNHIGMKLNINNENKDINCLCNEWNIIAKLNFYYKNIKNEPICLLCHSYCQNFNSNDKIVKIKENEIIPKCSCKNEEIHYDNRMICEKILDLVNNSDEFSLFFHPIQIMNMIFKSTNNFKMIFDFFESFNNNLNDTNNLEKVIVNFSKAHSADITYTNIFKTLIIFEKIIQKSSVNNYICYYNEQVLNYFSFNVIKQLILALNKSLIEEKLFWTLSNKYLYFFHKIYINAKILPLVKYKLNDIKNLSLFQKMFIFNNNKEIFKETDEIIPFLLKFIIDIIYKRFWTIDSIDCINEIFSILRKLSCYNLININYMIQICISITKCMNYINITRNSFNKNINAKNNTDVKAKNDYAHFKNIILKLYYIIIKMLLNFIYNYNDMIINNIIFNKEKYPDIDSINFKNVCFLYSKNELARLIFKITLYIITSIQKNYSFIDNKRTILIQKIGMDILQYSLNKNDNYLINIFSSLNKFKYYQTSQGSIININNNQYYKELIIQSNLITEAFYHYFNFEISIENMLEIINNSLNAVLEDSFDILKFDGNKIEKEFNQEQKIAILSSSYYSLISKAINIMCHHQNRNKMSENKFNKYLNGKNKIENNLNQFINYLPNQLEDEIIKKILYFYFCFSLNSSDNSFLVLSFYIFNELIRLPFKYSQLVFKLFYLCVKNISTTEKNMAMIDQSYIIKRLYNYLEKLMNEEKNINPNILSFCVYYYLKILEISVFYSNSLSFNIFIYKIQYIIFSIEKNYNLINKFFSMKKDEANILSNKKNDKFKNERSSEITLNTINERNSFSRNNQISNKSLIYEFQKNNILKKTFLIFIKLINDCFDFSLENDRKNIVEIIDVKMIIFALKNYKINLDLRTEFLRFLRKMILDLKFSYRENKLYTESIINNEDNFITMKNNPLINNYEYPTKFLSFLSDFYNITAKCNIKENIENKLIQKKNYLENINILNEDNKLKDINASHDLSMSGRMKIKDSVFIEDFNDNMINNSFFSTRNIRTFLQHIKNDNEKKKGKRLSFENKENVLNIHKKKYSLKYGNINHLFKITTLIKPNTVQIDGNDIINELDSIEEKSNKDTIISTRKVTNLNHDIFDTSQVYNIIQLNNMNDGLKEEQYSNMDDIDLNKNNLNKSFFKTRISHSIIHLEKNDIKNFKNTLLLPKSFKSRGSLLSLEKKRNSINSINNENEEISENSDEEHELNTDDLEELEEAIEENNDEVFYKKCKEMNLLEDSFNQKFYNIINYELENSQSSIEMIKLNTPEKNEYVRNYIENGILIPLIFYFKKIFTLVNLFTGKEMIKLHVLLEKSLEFKLYILKYKKDIWNNDINEYCLFNTESINDILEKNEMTNIRNYYYNKFRNSSILESSYFREESSINTTKESLYYIKSNKNAIFDYSLVYQIINKEFFCLLKDKKVLNIGQYFTEKNNYQPLNKKNIKEDEKLLNEKKNYSDIQKRLLKAIIIYKYNKISYFDENNSSFFRILNEINMEYEKSYRNLLINLLINFAKDINIKNEYGDISYFLLFKLMSVQPAETQNEIINILGGIESDDSGFLLPLNQNLFCRIVLLIIDFLNPSDKLIQWNYFVSCNIINIFKLLCANHNYFFQLHLVKSLSFDYSENNFSYFKFNIMSEISRLKKEKKDSFTNLKDHELILHNLKLYDFFLYLLLKIILISNWESKSNDKNTINPYLYDLFSSILDLLTEIIQGSKPELMSILFSSIDEKMIEMLGEGIDLEKFKKNESFEIFIKNIVNILFQENNNIQLIKEIKRDLMLYIISILEEKSNNNTIKKYIKKYININNIYRNISKILKIYFINNRKVKMREKLKNKIKKFIYFEKYNMFKKPIQNNINRMSMSYFHKYPRKKYKSIFGKIKKRQSNINIENTSANIKLINTTIDSHKELKNNLLLLNLRPRKGKKNLKSASTFKFGGKALEKKEKTVKNSSHILELELEKLTFGRNLYNYFKKQFYEEQKFIESFEFKLCNTFFRFIKILKYKKNKNLNQITEKKIKKLFLVNNMQKEDIFKDELNNEDINSTKTINIKDNENYEKDFIEKYYIEKFFEDITTVIEVRLNERINKLIIYTHLPEMKYLSTETKIDFKKNVNRDNETSKKYDLMRYVKCFIREIKYNKKYNSKLNIWFSKTNFFVIEKISYFLALIVNIFLLSTMKGDVQITNSDTLEERFKNTSKIQNSINNSNNQWNLIYQLLILIYLILNGIFIILWIKYKMPLYYRLDKVRYIETFKKDNNKKLCFLEKLYIIFKMCILGRNYISVLLYEFIICLISVLIKKSKIFIAFLLLPILYINKTLKSLVISIKLNFKQFFVTFVFCFMLIFIFADIYFFFLNNDFVTENIYFKDNFCKTLVFASLSALDNGLRARGGFGDSAIRISFLINKNHYLIRLLLDTLFFLLIIILMIDMVFGIIIKSFDEIRHRNQKYQSDKINYCFICHSNKQLLEKNRMNFNEHIMTHNIWNYVEYMIKLELEDIHDLKATNQYIRAKLERKDISWMPSYKDMNKENDIDIEDQNLIVSHEYVDEYKIKTINEI